MEDNKKFEYYVGLDVGTNSVGFAVTDKDYNVITRKGKPLMGVRLFEEAKPAQERRLFRANKVRRNRIKFRLRLLGELFEQEIEKVDPLFFIRLASSNLWLVDRQEKDERLNNLNSLFADPKYQDKHFFAQFKTIYHLRDYLMQESNWEHHIPDIRLVYLACHHIVKHRGHFLYSNTKIPVGDPKAMGQEMFKELNIILEQMNESRDTQYELLDLSQFAMIEDEARRYSGVRRRQEALVELLLGGAKKGNPSLGIVKMLSGAKTSVKDVDCEIECKESLSLAEWDDAKIGEYQEWFGDSFDLLVAINNVYDWFVLMRLLGGQPTLSKTMIRRYYQHKTDLKQIKTFVKLVMPEQFTEIFHDVLKSDYNYVAYVGKVVRGKPAIISAKHGDQGELCKYLRRKLKTFLEDKDYVAPEGIDWERIKEGLENNTFLPLLRGKGNATIPIQIHENELVAILENACKYYKLDKEKILSLFKFRIPYYVGRLNQRFNEEEGHSHRTWMVKRPEYQGKRTQIRPWNFSEIVDEEASAEAFITKMLSYCTYLHGELVAPKQSLIYSKFTVLNELNRLKIKGDLVSVERKQEIFNTVMMSAKTLSIKSFAKALGVEETDIQGIATKDEKLIISLAPFIDCRKIFGEGYLEPANMRIFDDVVFWKCLFKDSPEVVEKRLRSKYPKLNEEMVEKLMRVPAKDFGTISTRFLTDCAITDRESGRLTSIIDIMWETDLNLMGVIYADRYNVTQWLEEENGEVDQFDYDDIFASYNSPGMKRALNQSWKVLKEIVQLVGDEPMKIFIEVTRKEEKKEEKDSRKMQLQKLYGKILDKEKDKELLDQLEFIDNKKLRGTRYYLYFIQCGRCAYSGAPIDFEDLENDALYDVDHIIPQSVKKDDSLNNLVLAKKVLNMKKSNIYPLNLVSEIWSNSGTLLALWRHWYDCKLISKDKYQRLIRTKHLEESEIEEFIARQIVYTSQSAIAVAELFKRMFKDTEIVYAKASNVSAFRQHYELLKCRLVNDHHHAHDAYLNIVVGNVYNTLFTHDRKRFIKLFRENYSEEEKREKYSIKRVFSGIIPGVWHPSDTVANVRRHLGFKQLPVSKMTRPNTGQFYKQTIYPVAVKQKEVLKGVSEEPNKFIPVKGNPINPLSNTSRYGGFTGFVPAYFMIIAYQNKKGVEELRFHYVNLYDQKRWESLTDEERIAELAKEYKEPRIVQHRIPLGTKFLIGKLELRISGRSGDKVLFHNCKQWIPSREDIAYIRTMEKMNRMFPLNIKEIDQEELIVAGEEGTKLTIQKVSKVRNCEFWVSMLEKMEQMFYDPQLANRSLGFPDVPAKMREYFDDFQRATLGVQVSVLLGFLEALNSPKKFDFSPLRKGAPAEAGDVQPVAKITYPLIMVLQSVTGVLEKRIVINKSEVERGISDHTGKRASKNRA